MSASQLRTWGKVVLANPYSCAFYGWSYADWYFGRTDVKDALTYLGTLATSRAPSSCRKH
jgi:hypothetical protein